MQLLPFGAGASPSLGISSLLAELTDGTWTYHVDAWANATRPDDGANVERYRLIYDYLRVEALSEGASADRIAEAAKEAT